MKMIWKTDLYAPSLIKNATLNYNFNKTLKNEAIRTIIVWFLSEKENLKINLKYFKYRLFYLFLVLFNIYFYILHYTKVISASMRVYNLQINRYAYISKNVQAFSIDGESTLRSLENMIHTDPKYLLHPLGYVIPLQKALSVMVLHLQMNVVWASYMCSRRFLTWSQPSCISPDPEWKQIGIGKFERD